MSLGAKRAIIFDDDPAHAEYIRQMLLAQQRPGPFALDEEDIATHTSSAAFVDEWNQTERCDVTMVICDIHMPGGEREGALAVLKALSKVKSPPLLLVVTERIGESDDPTRQLIESIADDSECNVPVVVFSKSKKTPAVRDEDRQLDANQLAGYFARAVADRDDATKIKRLQREARLAIDVEPLAAFKTAFTRCAETRAAPVVVVVSEPEGLLSAFLGAFNSRKVEPKATLSINKFITMMNTPVWRDAQDDGPIAFEDADSFLTGVLSDGGGDAYDALQSLQDRQILQDDQVFPFRGQIYLQVSPVTAEALSNDVRYRRIPQFRIPSVGDMRSDMLRAGRRPSQPRADLNSLARIAISNERVAASEFDLAVMTAYDWSLGYDGPRGYAGMRQCAETLSRRAEGGRVPEGLAAELLTQTEVGRASIYGALDKAHLLRLVLERVKQEARSAISLQVATFLYHKLLCTTGEQAEKDAEFFGQRNLVAHLNKKRNSEYRAWPPLSDLFLYRLFRGDGSGRDPFATLKEHYGRTLDSLVEPLGEEEQAAVKSIWESARSGSKGDVNDQLSALDRPFKATLRN